MSAAEGVGVIACTPHITPGVYDNDGASIRAHIARLQSALDEAHIPVSLVIGADVHIAPRLVEALRSGAAPTLHDTRYVLVEPPHHVMPPLIEEFFAELIAAGYAPILTHPERLTWIGWRPDMIRRLFDIGVWMQVTAGALHGDFGAKPKYWAERLIGESMCHILATDAHDSGGRRRPRLRAGYDAAVRLVGEEEAANLVYWRPLAILENRAPQEAPPLPAPPRRLKSPPSSGWGRARDWAVRSVGRA